MNGKNHIFYRKGAASLLRKVGVLGARCVGGEDFLKYLVLTILPILAYTRIISHILLNRTRDRRRRKLAICYPSGIDIIAGNFLGRAKHTSLVFRRGPFTNDCPNVCNNRFSYILHISNATRGCLALHAWKNSKIAGGRHCQMRISGGSLVSCSHSTTSFSARGTPKTFSFRAVVLPEGIASKGRCIIIHMHNIKHCCTCNARHILAAFRHIVRNSLPPVCTVCASAGPVFSVRSRIGNRVGGCSRIKATSSSSLSTLHAHLRDNFGSTVSDRLSNSSFGPTCNGGGFGVIRTVKATCRHNCCKKKTTSGLTSGVHITVSSLICVSGINGHNACIGMSTLNGAGARRETSTK